MWALNKFYSHQFATFVWLFGKVYVLTLIATHPVLVKANMATSDDREFSLFSVSKLSERSGLSWTSSHFWSLSETNTIGRKYKTKFNRSLLLSLYKYNRKKIEKRVMINNNINWYKEPIRVKNKRKLKFGRSTILHNSFAVAPLIKVTNIQTNHRWNKSDLQVHN